MVAIKHYENYPIGIVILSNFVSLAVYGIGFFIMSRLGLAFSLFYLLYIIILEYRLLKNHCTNCYYWGKICGFGRGKLSSWFFKKGDTSKFCIKNMTWKDMIPDMLMSLIPLTIGIVLLIMKFNLLMLSALLLLVLLTTSGNGYIRGKLTCKYCKQRESGCPAYLLFNKSKE